MVLREFLKCSIGWSEDSVVGRRAIENLDEVVVLVDEFRKLGSVLAAVDEFVDSQVRLVAMMRVVWMVRTAMMRWLVVRRLVVALEDIDVPNGRDSRIKP